nr:MAG TPA: Integrase [Caudoviricetes sp.]
MARQRGNKWQGDARYKGDRVRQSFDTKQAAELWEKAVALADASGAPLPGDLSDNGSVEHTLEGFSKKYFNFLWGSAKSSKSIQGKLNSIIEYFWASKPLREIDYSAVIDMVESFKKDGNSNATINRKLSTLYKLLRHARKVGYIEAVPEGIKLTENQGRIRFLTREEEAAVLKRFLHLGLTEAYHLTRFLLYTGARRGESDRLEHRDVDLKKGTVTFWETKGNKPGTVPLTQPAREAIEWCRREYPESSKVFGLKYETYANHWDRVRLDLGYMSDPQFVPHALRHTCASRLVQAGVDLRRVQQWMRHKSIQTTLRYAHLAPDDLQLAAQALVA